MHRATPSDSSFRGYGSGTRAGVVKQVFDKNGIQTADSGMMAGESREGIEFPQNYGFTSVCADADADGKKGPEAQINFSGGNGSFPVGGAMEDRRHRLLELDKVAKGSVGMYGLKEWGQQLLNTEKGWFMTGNLEKKLRLQLVENQQKKQGGGQGSGGGGASATQFAAGDGGGGDGGGGESGGEGGEDSGQKTLHEKESEYYIDVTKKMIEHVHKSRHKIVLADKETAVDIADGQVYVGKVKEKQHQKLAHRGSIDSRGHGIVARVSVNTWTPPGS